MASDVSSLKTLQASPDYSVTISLEYAQDFWQNALASPIYRLLELSIGEKYEEVQFCRILFPPIMRILRRLGQLRDGRDDR